MTPDEEERRDLVYDIAKIFGHNYLPSGSCAAALEMISKIATGQTVHLTLNFPAMRLIKKSPLVWERMFKYIAEGYVKP